MDLFQKYKEEIIQDTKFDQLNILEKQLILPSLKHKWVSRLIEQKIHKNNLEKKKKDLKLEVLKTLSDKGIPSGIPKAALNSKVESSEIIKKIDDEIQHCIILIDYLEKVEKIMSTISYDLSTATKLISMETT